MTDPDRQPLPGCYWQIVAMLAVVAVVSIFVIVKYG